MGKPTLPPNDPIPPIEILNALTDATSQDASRLKAAEEKIKQYGERLGTWEVVHQIASQPGVPLQVRQMALIQFKNGGLSRWKSRRLFEESHRNSIRNRCFLFLSETDDSIAVVNAFVMAKIARTDYPTAWPQVTAGLGGMLQNNLATVLSEAPQATTAILCLCRVLYAMSQIVKELATMKMPSGIKATQDLLAEWATPFLDSYLSFQEWVEPRITSNVLGDPLVAEYLKILHLFFKPLSRMMLWLWGRADKPEFSNAAPMLNRFFEIFTVQWAHLNELRFGFASTLAGSGSQVQVSTLSRLTKHINAIGKSLRKWQRVASNRFIRLPNCHAFVMGYWSLVEQASSSDSIHVQENDTALYPVQFITLGMSIFKDALTQWARQADGSGFSPSRDALTQSIEIVVSKYLPLRSEDLARWADDPEEWSNNEEKESDAWEFDLRPCSERLLMTLASHYGDIVGPILYEEFARTATTTPVTFDGILQKEALYCAVGCCVHRLKGDIDFEEWIKYSRMTDLQSLEPNFRILKRRVAWIIGKWIGEVNDGAMSTTVWQILAELLRDRGPSSDAVVRSTAATSVKHCVDTLDFNWNSLNPHVGDIIQGLLSVISELDSQDGKRRVLSSLGILVERGGKQVAPHCKDIIDSIPILWSKAEADLDFLFMAAILSVMTHVVNATEGDSILLLPTTIPLIRGSLSKQNKVQLDQDALILWLAVLRNAPSLQSGRNQDSLLDLFPLAIEFLSEDLDILGTTLSVVESYCLLDCSLLLKLHARELFLACGNAITRAIISNVKDVLQTMQLLVTLAQPSYWDGLHESGLSVIVLKNIREDKIPVPVMIEHIMFLARISLSDPIALFQIVDMSAKGSRGNGEALMSDLLDQWCEKFDNMSEPRHRKLLAMGLGSLLATGHPELLQRLPVIFNLWLDCFAEIREAEAEAERPGSPLTMFWQHRDTFTQAFLTDSEGTWEGKRRALFLESDIVQTVTLKSFIGAKLAQAESAGGYLEAVRVLQQNEENRAVLQAMEKELRDL